MARRNQPATPPSLPFFARFHAGLTSRSCGRVQTCWVVLALPILLVIDALLVLLDLVVAGGAVTGTCASIAMGALAHPIGWFALLVIVIIIASAIGARAWG